MLSVPCLKINFQLPITYEERRYEDLKKQGIQFEESFYQEFKKEKIRFQNKPHVLKAEEAKFPLFMKGLLLTGSFSKGQSISLFLRKLDWKPQNIIFIDNNLHHLKSFQEKAQALGIRYEGLHFTYVNQMSENFSSKWSRKVAHYLCQYGRWPSEGDLLFSLKSRRQRQKIS